MEPKSEAVLNQIFEKRTGIDFSKNPELKDKKLLAEEINLPVRELVLLLYDMEHQLGIRIPKKAVLEGKFDSYFHITELLVP
jgi:peptide maturation system acyl carrier-related protein